MNHRWIEAEDEYLKALAIEGQSASVLEDYNEFLDGVGHWDKSIEYGELAARLEPFRPVFQMASAFRGEADGAFEWLQKAVAYNDPGLAEIATESLFANIRADPRWLPFLESIGMSPEQLEAIEFNVTLPE